MLVRFSCGAKPTSRAWTEPEDPECRHSWCCWPLSRGLFSLTLQAPDTSEQTGVSAAWLWCSFRLPRPPRKMTKKCQCAQPVHPWKTWEVDLLYLAFRVSPRCTWEAGSVHGVLLQLRLVHVGNTSFGIVICLFELVLYWWVDVPGIFHSIHRSLLVGC